MEIIEKVSSTRPGCWVSDMYMTLFSKIHQNHEVDVQTSSGDPSESRQDENDNFVKQIKIC